MNNIKLDRKQQIIFTVIFLNLAIMFVYGPVHHYEFVNYDDNIYVIDNINVCRGLTWENVWWALTATEAGFWHPLTWISLMGDHELYLMNAGGYHGTNVILHAISATLLFFVFYRMTGALWLSGCVAALFAVHPLHVEPVAWIAARKDVLSTLFWMLTMWAYMVYAQRPGVWRYLLVFLFYGLGLMSKPMVVTLPAVLLLMDYWPLRRFEVIPTYRLIVEKTPLILLSLPVIWLTFAAEKNIGALGSLAAFPWGVRLPNALVSYVLYLWKTVYPIGLSVYYPHAGQWPLWATLSAVGLLASVTIFAICWRKRYPYLIVGWLWYLTVLLPVIGLVQIGSHSMADRYTYIPLIGIFVMLVWGVAAVWKSSRYKIPIQAGLSFLLIIVFVVISSFQLNHWRNGVVLARHTLDVIGKNSGTFNNLGNALARRGQTDDAILQYKEALQLKPDYPDALNNLGNALVQKGNITGAVSQYTEALRLDPGNVKVHFNIAVAFAILKRDQNAVSHYREVLIIKPDFVEAWNNLAIIYANQGDLNNAILHFRKALQINPHYKAAQDNLALALQQQRDSGH